MSFSNIIQNPYSNVSEISTRIAASKPRFVPGNSYVIIVNVAQQYYPDPMYADTANRKTCALFSLIIQVCWGSKLQRISKNLVM